MKNKHLRLRLVDDGCDVFAPREGKTWGYRYGPSIIQYGDGRIDAWFASPGGCGVEADWFTYRHSDDDGATWTDEKVVMYPTPDSMDLFSVCDPAVIIMDGWYYMGYTSTIFVDGGGVCNNAFVARSRRPDGPWYKWTGTGWGEERETIDDNGEPATLHWQGLPAPIIYYDEPWQNWGAGEPSFVRVGDTLYMYYTWTSKDKDGNPFSQTRVATADLTAGDNWPATLTPRGIAIRRPGGGCDSCDVVYVDEAEKFLILCTDKRFTTDSRLAVYESDDGLTFTRVCEVRTNVGEKCHNCGIAGGPDRHVSLHDKIAVAYAYGSQWGYWGTRFQKAVLDLVDEPDFSDADKPSAAWPVQAWPMPEKPWPIHITTKPHYHVRKVSQGAFDVDLKWLDTAYNVNTCPADEVSVAAYDPTVVRFDGLTCTPLRPGYTYAVAHWQGHTVEFPVFVPTEDTPDRDPKTRKLVRFTPQVAEYTLYLAEKEVKQVRGCGVYSDGSWFEVYKPEAGVTLSGYDETLLAAGPEATFTALAVGSTPLTVSCQGLSFTVQVNILPAR